MSLEVIALDHLSIPQAEQVVHARAQHPSVLQELARGDPVSVPESLVVQISQALAVLSVERVRESMLLTSCRL